MERIVIGSDLVELLSSPDLEGRTITIRNRTYTLGPKAGAGFKSVVRRCMDELGIPYAVKLATAEDYVDRSYLQEVFRNTQLWQCPHVTRLVDWGELSQIQGIDKPLSLVGFVTDWIDGQTLERFTTSGEIGVSFLRAYVRAMCEILQALKAAGLRHDDLHGGNIMISDPLQGSLDPEVRRVLMIDTGSLKPASSPLAKKCDDVENFVGHLVMIINAILRKRENLRLVDKRYLDSVRLLLEQMCDEPPRRLDEPRNIRDGFESAWDDARSSGNVRARLRLNSPFDFMSAEQVTDDQLLTKLFSTKCPWVDDLKGPDAVNLFGPRGCGKSTLFRMFRLQTLLRMGKTALRNSKEVGFYVSCSQDIRNRLAYVDEATALRLQREIVHYFNLVLVQEIVTGLALARDHPDAEKLFGWTETTENGLFEFLTHNLGLPKDRLQGARPLDHLLDLLASQLWRAHDVILRGGSISDATTPSLLAEVSNYLKDSIPFFATRRILILIDDYSAHRVPSHLQKVLNLVIWHRQGSHVFKVSSETGGLERADILGGTADETRDMREINCGERYLDLSTRGGTVNKTRAFAEDIINRRLRLAGYGEGADIRKILGKTSYDLELDGKILYKGPSIGRAFWSRARLEPPSRAKVPIYYHGVECLADLCSGDISTMLDLVKHTFDTSGTDAKNQAPIQSHDQHGAIQDFSRRLFDEIRTYTPSGLEMQQIVHAFGSASRTLLDEHPGVISRKQTRDPYEMIRIEVDDPVMKSPLSAADEDLLRELLRRSIFIELRPGRSRRGGLARRYQMRRIYCPTFGMSLAHSEPMALSFEHFRALLQDPKPTCQRHVERVLGRQVTLTSPQLAFDFVGA